MKLRLLTELDEKDVIQLTPEWLSTEYDRLNAELFDGKLMSCDFAIFTSGKGSEGGTLGWFKITGTGIYVSKSSRRMYRKISTNSYYGNEKEYVDKNNFVEICKPRIELNGNYRWSRKAALSTLVHEMCHYYCNMYGWRPAQHHGNDFRAIAFKVSQKSNEFFTVERIARAEQMTEMELNSMMSAKKARRLENKKSKVIAMFLFMTNGEVRYINAISWDLVGKIERLEIQNGKCKKIILSQDADLVQKIFDMGYRHTMRVYRYWDFTGKPILNELENYNISVRWEKE